MRLYSNQDSSNHGVPTVLGVVETTLAIFLSYRIGYTTGNWWHIPIGALVALLALLRTDISCALAIRLGSQYFAFVKGFDPQNFIETPTRDARTTLACQLVAASVVTSLFVVAPIVILAFRFYATALAFVFFFNDCIRQIPKNFARATMAVDSLTPLLIFPVPENFEGETEYLTMPPDQNEIYAVFLNVVKQLAETKVYVDGRCGRILFIVFLAMTVLILAVILLLLGAIAIVSRFSIKMTAVIWFPLWFVLKPIKPEHRPWSQQLAIEWDDEKPQFARNISILFLCMLAVSYVAWAAQFYLWTTSKEIPRQLAQLGIAGAPVFWDSVSNLIQPGVFEIWQLAGAINCILGIYYWRKVKTWLIEIKHGDAPQEQTIDRLMTVLFRARRSLSLYTTACNFYIAIRVAMHLPLPRINTAIFPWR